MCSVRVLVCAAALVLFSWSSLDADPRIIKSKTLTVFGTLMGEPAPDSKLANWYITLNTVITVGGTQISSLTIKSADSHKLSSLEDKFVEAKGKVTLVSGSEASQPPVIELWSIKELKNKEPKR